METNYILMGNLTKCLNEALAFINEEVANQELIKAAFDAFHSSREDYIYMIPSQLPKEVKEELSYGLSALGKAGYLEYDSEVDHDDNGRTIGSEDYFWLTEKGMALSYDDFESYFIKPSGSKSEYNPPSWLDIDEEEEKKSIHSPTLVKNATNLAKVAVRKLDSAVRTGVVGTIYPNFDVFMADVWTNLPWTPEGMKVALEWISNNTSAIRIVKAVKDKFNYDLESEIEDKLKDAREKFQAQYNEKVDEAEDYERKDRISLRTTVK